jgi:riboflavin synthase
MFTGIVSDVGTVVSVAERAQVRRLTIATDRPWQAMVIGNSVAVSGVCLTIVSFREEQARSLIDVDAAPETLKVTTAGEWRRGTRLNLERPLRVGDELGGHLVSGHVDGLATVVARDDLGESVRFAFSAPVPLTRFIAAKGSVALDGTSLTVNSVDGNAFDCLMIPHTLAATTWADRRVRDRVNLEVDTLARYVARLAETRQNG